MPAVLLFNIQNGYSLTVVSDALCSPCPMPSKLITTLTQETIRVNGKGLGSIIYIEANIFCRLGATFSNLFGLEQKEKEA